MDEVLGRSRQCSSCNVPAGQRGRCVLQSELNRLAQDSTVGVLLQNISGSLEV